MEKGIFITVGIIVVVVGAILAGVYFTGGSGPDNTYLTTDPNTKGAILFYGEGCPHCKIVDDFILENNITEKVNFAHSEVWHNKSNAQLLGQKAQICGISADTVGIPFLFDGDNKCYVGDVDIINFFKNEANIK